jgi:thioesterase domain-containing protein
MMNEIHAEFGVQLPLGTLFETRTVRGMAERLSRHLEAAKRTSTDLAFSPIVRITSGGTLPPFFCVAGQGGNPMELRELAEMLGPDQPFIGLQYRGVDGRDPPWRRIEDLAMDFAQGIRSVQPRGPYYLGGYSAGGLAAYELARVLHHAGEDVPVVILIDTLCPTMQNWSWRERIRAHAANISTHGLEYLVDRGKAHLLRRIAQRKRAKRAALAADEPFKYRVEAVLTASLQAERDYQPERYDGNVVLIRADFRFGVESGIGYRLDPLNGWGAAIGKNLKVESVRSGHSGIIDQVEGLHQTAEIIRRSLEEARRHK